MATGYQLPAVPCYTHQVINKIFIMETIQKFAVPLAIVIAGALIAGALYFVGIGKAPAGAGQGQVLKNIRTVQKDDHVLGNADAKITIVEFSDPECPFCKQFHATMHKVIEAYGADGKVAWIYRHYPIAQLHPKAQKESEALECAGDQGGTSLFWEYADKLYETTNSNNSLDIGVYNLPKDAPTGPDGKPYYTQKAPGSSADAGQLSEMAVSLGLDKLAFETCLSSNKFEERVKKDSEEAAASGARGTPNSIIIVGKEQVAMEGAQPFEAVKTLIDTLLKK